MKDKWSTLLEECQCYQDGQGTGIVDNFLKIDGTWLPCEAKLNILSENNIFGQVAKYTNIDCFVPTRGARRSERFDSEKSGICLVVDQSGLYIISSHGVFLDCDYGEPVWKREEFGQIDPSQFKAPIRRYH